MQCLRFGGQIAMSNPGISKIEFAADSPLEGDGFEPSVPRVMGAWGTGRACQSSYQTPRWRKPDSNHRSLSR
jgi:hypothetical protein